MGKCLIVDSAAPSYLRMHDSVLLAELPWRYSR